MMTARAKYLLPLLLLFTCLAWGLPAAGAKVDPVMRGLAAADLFQGLKSSQVKQVAALGKVRKLAAGETFIHYDRHMKTIFVLIAGKAKVILKSGEVAAEVGPGTTLGEMELADQMPASASVQMKGKGAAVVVPMAALRSLMRVDPKLGLVVMTNVAKKISRQLRARQ